MNDRKMKVETIDRELIMTRDFDAPRKLVFEAFSNCEHLSHWWGTHEYPISYCKMDFREGGIWHFCLRGPAGQESWGKAAYQEIIEPERITYTDNFSDSEGNVNEKLPGMLITVDFLEFNGRTRLISTTRFTSAEELKKIMDMGVVQGFTESWDRLEEHLEQNRTHKKSPG